MRHTHSRHAVVSATSRRVLDRLKVKLLRDARVTLKAGEIIEVSPASAEFLVSVGNAEIIAEKAVLPKVEEAEKAVKAPMAGTTPRKTATVKAKK